VVAALACLGLVIWWFGRAPEPPAIATGPDPVAAPAAVEAPPVPDIAFPVTPARSPEASPATGGGVAEDSRAVRDDVPDPVAAKPGNFPASLDLDALAGPTSAQTGARDKALQEAFSSGDWGGYRALLERSLLPVAARWLQAPTAMSGLGQAPALHQALVQRAVLSRLGDKALQRLSSDATARPFHQWLLTTPEAAEALLVAVAPGRSADAVLPTWAELWNEDAEARGKYLGLALACALVFESPRTFKWNGESIRVSAGHRYNWYKVKDASGSLVGHIDRMSARDLVWVVGAPVPDSELEWALASLNLRQKNWGTTYDKVPYDMNKAVNGGNPYDSYTFAEILEKGGVCTDRAYFAVNTARAAGIPAAELSGDGARGPHAWMTWLDDRGEWRSTGRFDGYGLGTTRNPCGGERLSEQEFVSRSADAASSERRFLAAHRWIWLSDLLASAGRTPDAGAALDLAVKADRRLPAATRTRLEFWLRERREHPLDDWRSLVAELKKGFREDPELAALARRAEDEIIFPRQNNKSVLADLRRDARKMDKESENDGITAQARDVARAYSRQAAVLKESGDFDGIRAVYRKALSDVSDAALFKELARDFFRAVEGRPEVAPAACRDMEQAWNRHVDTGGDYFDVTSQNSALEVIIGCYRQVGDTDKAASLQKELDRRLKKATRQAL
jgi:hypothetical protein